MILGGPYNSGILTGGVTDNATHDYAQAPAPLIDKARKIEAVCKRHGVPLAAAALQFPLHHPMVASVIPGGFRPEHVSTNVAHMWHEIPSELWAELKQQGLIRKDAPTP